MKIKLKIADDDIEAHRILNNAERVAQRCAAWPARKRGGERTVLVELIPPSELQ